MVRPVAEVSEAFDVPRRWGRLCGRPPRSPDVVSCRACSALLLLFHALSSTRTSSRVVLSSLLLLRLVLSLTCTNNVSHHMLHMS